MTDPQGIESELQAAIVGLGIFAVALIVAARTIFDLLRDREAMAGRRLTAEEREAILTATNAIVGLDERLSAIESTLQSMTEKLDLLIARSNRPRATDRGR